MEEKSETIWSTDNGASADSQTAKCTAHDVDMIYLLTILNVVKMLMHQALL